MNQTPAVVRVLWALLLTPLLVGALLAQSPDEQDDRLSLAVGAGLIVSPRPYVDTDPKIFPVPVVNARYKRLFFEGIRGGVEALKVGDLSGNAYVQANFRGLEAADSGFLEGMETRRKSADGGLELLYRGRPVGFRVNLLTDLLGRSKGQELSLQALTGAPLGKVFLLAGVGPRWISGKRADYYYGVRQGEVRPDRAAYLAEATWNWDLSVGVRFRPTSKWTFLAIFNREGFGSGIESSPLIGQSAGATFIASLTYSIR